MPNISTNHAITYTNNPQASKLPSHGDPLLLTQRRGCRIDKCKGLLFMSGRFSDMHGEASEESLNWLLETLSTSPVRRRHNNVLYWLSILLRQCVVVKPQWATENGRKWLHWDILSCTSQCSFSPFKIIFNGNNIVSSSRALFYYQKTIIPHYHQDFCPHQPLSVQGFNIACSLPSFNISSV